jgi:hypothetical protein
MTPGELALNLHLEEPGKDYQPQKKQKKAKKWLGNEILFVSLCRCGEKRFLFTRRKRRWGEGGRQRVPARREATNNEQRSTINNQ